MKRRKRAMAVLLSAVMGTMLLQPTVSFAVDSQDVTSGTVTQWEWVWPDEADHKDDTLTIETSEMPISWDKIKDLLPKEICATVVVEKEQEPQELQAPEGGTGGSDSKDTTGKDTNTDKDTNTGGTTGETNDSNKTDDVNAGENADTESDTDEETNTGNTGDVTSSKDDLADAGDRTPGEIETEPAGGVTDGAEISVNSQTAAALALPNTLYLVEGDGQNSAPSGDGGKQIQTIPNVVIDVTWNEEDTVSDGDTLTAEISDGFDGFTLVDEVSELKITVKLQEPTANPTFTVQYYANLDLAKTDDQGGYLKIIDTSGRNLPKNGGSIKEKRFYLVEAGNGKRKINTEEKLTKVYEDHSFQFLGYNELENIDRLSQNRHYKLVSVWVSSDSTDPNNWVSYDPNNVRFTNDPESVDKTTVLVTEDTVIRLVYDPTDGTYNNAVNFYDYDITDNGKITRGTDGTTYGINSDENYSGSGAKFAFGNANTGTGLENETWEGNTLNQYNRITNGYNGCTFGLVIGLDTSGNIQYAPGVNAPKLFNDGDAKGKISYENGEFSLNFNRVGDTYTLTSVGGSDVKDLEYFNNPTTGNVTYQNIWTNNFWPMDDRPSTDGKTGTFSGNYSVSGTPIHAMEKYTSSGKEDSYPPSDDGIAHNNMFGMQYAVKFTLTEDYCGPLEYYFFGDDDMWVFLTDPDGDSQLVCDIGGVHSSVGEYVDLWDYIKKESEGEYTLTFFYTERGLSGSTCWMQFTLPSVSSVTPGQSTGTLTVEKNLVDESADSNKTFKFTLNLEDENGKPLTSHYPFISDGNNGNIGDGDSFTLKKGESITIHGLPLGTKYTVTETPASSAGYEVTYTNESGSITKDASNVKVTVTNTALGNLTVKKSVVGEASADAEFTITITLDDPSINGQYGAVTFANGAATVTLKNGASVTATGLPAGIGYTVEETEESSAGYNVTYTGEKGTIAAGATAEVTVTNTVPTPDPECGTLIVTKHVTGNDANKSKEFTFTVKLSDKTVTGPYGDMTFNGGKATFRLRDGESATATNLPAGITYSVTEAEANQDGYDTSSTNASGTIPANSTAEAVFTNHRDKETPPPPPPAPPARPAAGRT